MRRLIWLMAFAVAALLFGAPERAFAHPGHDHAPAAHSNAAPEFEIIFAANGDALYFDQFASAAERISPKCQHGLPNSSCDECFGCGAHVSVALHANERASAESEDAVRHLSAASAYLLRYTTSDLTRPPKSFA